MSKETELLPCPFCGSSASGYAIEAHSHTLKLADGFKMPDHGGSYVVEGDCGCGSGMIGETQQEVTLRWNRRAADRELRRGDAIDAAPGCVEKPAADVHMPVFGWGTDDGRIVTDLTKTEAMPGASRESFTTALVRQSDAQAALVAKDAEIIKAEQENAALRLQVHNDAPRIKSLQAMNQGLEAEIAAIAKEKDK